MSSISKAKEKAKKISKSKKIKLKDALTLVAKEKSFTDWKSYKDSLDTFWYRDTSPFLNHWFSKYKEAKEFQKKEGGFLLTFKGHYFVASRDYIEYLGIDPDDPIWKAIDYDVSFTSALEKFHNYYQKAQEK